MSVLYKPMHVSDFFVFVFATYLSASIPPRTEPIKAPKNPREVDKVTHMYFPHTKSHWTNKQTLDCRNWNVI